LNYRIDLPREEVLNTLANDQNAIEKLYEHDQLAHQMAKQNVFYGWSEGPIKFTPTYKYMVGTREYTEKKQRIPSWCDRVLWKSLPGTYRLHQTNYSSSDALTTSDHSPVYATFQLKARLPIHARFLKHSGPISDHCRILIYELQGLNLVPRDSNGTAAPLLEIAAPFLDPSPVGTGIIHRTLSPVWSGAISLKPAVGARSYLEHQHLHMRVVDSQNDSEIGQVALSLSGAFETDPIPFVLTLTRHGRPSGSISGKLHVLYSN